MQLDLRWTIPATLAALALASPLVAEWLRHRPERLTQGTQHIVLLGLLAFNGFGILAVLSAVWLCRPG